MKDLVFLPDREGRDALTATTGFVRLGADENALRDLANRLVTPGAKAAEADTAAWRGSLATALLADTWADADLRVTVLTIEATTSLFAAWVLASRPLAQRNAPVHLVLLEASGRKALLGIADPHAGLILPATASDLSLLPPLVRWYDREAAAFRDPTPHLTQQERDILQRRLELLHLDAPQAAAFTADLAAAYAQQVEVVRAQEESALSRLATRVQAVHGLADFPAFADQATHYAWTAPNALVTCLADADIPESVVSGEAHVYLWDGIPFAQTDTRIGLTDVASEEQDAALDAIAADIALMAAQSTAWNRRTGKSLAAWLDKQTPLLPEAREQLETLRHALSDAGRQVQLPVTLTWPWQATGAVRALLREALGDGWMRAAENPFSDRLTKLTGHVFGDSALQTCCACADGILLPPLSAEMAACAAAAKDGEGLALDALRFQPQEDGGITASFLLRGAGEVVLTRSYAVKDILVLAEEEAPTVAVWPGAPLERWRAYHVFTRPAPVRVAALCGGVWTPCPETDHPWACLHTESYPACLMVMQDDLALGCLPNALPVYRVAAEKPAVAAIDLGTATTSVVLSLDGRAAPLKEQQLTRLLVMPQDMQADDELLSLTPRSSAPTAVEITGPGETLFVDGHIYRASSFEALAAKEAATIRSALKWRADAASVRARRLLLEQVMLGASLCAMMEGADSITWRVTVADEMDDDGRQETLDTMETLASLLAEKTGLPLTLGQPAVTWAEEAAAQCAYLRGDGNLRGSFTALDMGSGSTKLHLWMQGKNRPTAGAVLLDGTQTMLLSALRAHPEMLAYDFADCPDEAVQAAMQTLEGQLSQAELSLAENDKAQLMLNTVLDELCQPISQHMYARAAAQRPTFMQAILLENQAAAMFIVGLMLAQVGSDTLVNHLLPDDMTVCITGRGAWLLDSLAPAQRNALQQIPRQVMRLDNPVRFISVKAAPQASMSVALGMAAARETGVPLSTPAIRTRASFSQLMCDFLCMMIGHYPQHAWLLHEGLFDPWGQVTQQGEDIIRREASKAFGDGEDIPASVMDFVKRMQTMQHTSEATYE